MNPTLRQVTFTITLVAALIPAALGDDWPFIRDGKAGFVVSDFAYALGPDAAETKACPQGLSRNLMEIYAIKHGVKRRANESEEDFSERLQAGGKSLARAANGQDLCLHPEAGDPDPFYQTLQGNDIAAQGINLDGESGAEDFPGGVDNQFYRVVGCSRSYQSSGQSNSFAIEMLTGSWGIVIDLEGVDDIRNDEEVIVGIAANADPIQLSAAREPLAYATYAKDQDARFRAVTTGRIEEGVLTTQPVTVRFHSSVNSMVIERPLHDARLQATISDSGEMKGFLSGYTPVEDLYDFAYGYREGRALDGKLSPLRSQTANGAAMVLGHTCHGVYHALYEQADAYPDPQTGRNTAISTQYRFDAVPAFVVDVKTQSVNAALKLSAEVGDEK